MTLPSTPTQRLPARAALLLLAALLPLADAQAWSLTLAAASRRVFLHVGNGTANGDNSTVNTVSVSLSGAQLLSGAPVSMSTDSSQSTSLYDGFTTCPTPSSQIMVGASYRRRNASDGPASAVLSVSSPASLVNTAGETIPFTEISWSVAAPGSSQPSIIPAGSFTGGTQTLTTVPANTYIENCHSFSYANSAVRAAGTYSGQVTYTLTSP